MPTLWAEHRLPIHLAQGCEAAMQCLVGLSDRQLEYNNRVSNEEVNNSMTSITNLAALGALELKTLMTALQREQLLC